MKEEEQRGAKISGGHLVAKALKQEGVEYIFTLMGGHISEIYRGCLREGIKIIDMRHEQAAAHAAEGWSQVTGHPGVAVVTGGPGVTDTVTAVACAFKRPSPMVLIGGGTPLEEWEIGSPQDLDGVELMRPITKWSRSVIQTERIPEYVSIAFRQTIGGSPGPAFLEIPEDILLRNLDESQVVFPTKYRTEARAQGDPDCVREAAKLLVGARAPVVIAGTSVRWSEAGKELRELIQIAQAPVYLIGLARGSVSPEHPLHFVHTRRFALSQADVIVVVGTPFDFRLDYGRVSLFAESAKVIHVEVESSEVGRNRPVDVGIVGDIKAILGQLVEQVSKVGGRKDTGWIDRLRQEEKEIEKRYEPYLNSEAVPIHPLRLCRELRDFLDKDAIVVGDGGNIVTYGSWLIKARHLGHWLDPGPLGCLGIGTGYAIAAKLAKPDKQVLLLNGDGAFGLNGMEFDTMARHQIPVVGVVGNNGAWGGAWWSWRNGVLYRSPRVMGIYLDPRRRYDKMVESLGGYGELVEKPEEIRPALGRAFASGLPALINVLIDPTVGHIRAGSRERAESKVPLL